MQSRSYCPSWRCNFQGLNNGAAKNQPNKIGEINLGAKKDDEIFQDYGSVIEDIRKIKRCHKGLPGEIINALELVICLIKQKFLNKGRANISE